MWPQIASCLVGTHMLTHELIEFSPWPMREASQCPHFTEEQAEAREVKGLIQALQRGCAPDPILWCPESWGSWPACMFPESPSCLVGLTLVYPQTQVLRQFLRSPRSWCWPSLPAPEALASCSCWGLPWPSAHQRVKCFPRESPGKPPPAQHSPLWSASRRRPSFRAHPPGPPGSGLGSPSSCDRKPHISLQWRVTWPAGDTSCLG